MTLATFHQRAQAYLEHLTGYYESWEALEVEPDADALMLTAGDAVFLLNIHGTTQQIWLSSPLTGGHYFSYHEDQKAWLDIRTSVALQEFLDQELQKILGLQD